MIPITLPPNGWMSDEATTVDVSPFLKVFRKCLPHTFLTSGYLDLVQRLEFGVDHLQKNAVYQIE